MPIKTWLLCCERRDGPVAKQGYSQIPFRVLADIQGVVGHSMEGPLSAAYGELDNPNRMASWTISNPKAGKPKQHYPLESVTWPNGSPAANKLFIGIENEGVAGEQITPNQIGNWVAILTELKPLLPQVLEWQRPVSLREHREMTAYGALPTACPSNRIHWPTIIAGLEDDMGVTQEEFAAYRAAEEKTNKSLADYGAALSKEIAALRDQLAAHKAAPHSGGLGDGTVVKLVKQ